VKKKKQTAPAPVAKAAREYVKAQLEVMKRHGHSPKLSTGQYEALVTKIERATTGQG